MLITGLDTNLIFNFLNEQLYPHISHATKGLNVLKLDLVFVVVLVLMDMMVMVSIVKR